MFVELFFKEFKFNRKSRKLSSRILSAVFALIGAALIVALIVYMTIEIDNKITKYAPDSSTDFVSFFLFIFLAFQVIEGTMRARKSMYNEIDTRVITPLSITSDEIVTAKMTYIYVYQLAESFILSYSLLAAYGYNRGAFPQFYVISLFYPIYISVITTSLCFLLVSLFQVCYLALKGHDIIQFALATVVVIGLCFLYQFFLDLFLNALNDSSIGAVFSDEFIAGMETASTFFFPVSNYMNAWLDSYNIVSNTLWLFAAVILFYLLGHTVASICYRPLVKMSQHTNSGKKRDFRPQSKFKSLVHKEIAILFRNSGETFSYTALLIMMPFLSYVVISALSDVLLKNLAAFSYIFPDFVDAIVLCLVLLFVTCINASGSMGMSREGKSLQIVKFLPVDAKSVMLSKLLAPCSLSTLSTIVTMIVLYATGTVDLTVFWAGLVCGILLVFVCNLLGLYIDMWDQGGRNFNFLNTLVSLLIPVLIAVITVALDLTELSSGVIFLIDCAFVLACLLITMLIVATTYKKAFISMEARQR